MEGFGMARLKDWQERLVEEKAQADEKVKRLDAFVRGPKFDGIHVEDRALLREQLAVMTRYAEILQERVSRFAWKGIPARVVEEAAGGVAGMEGPDFPATKATPVA